MSVSPALDHVQDATPAFDMCTRGHQTYTPPQITASAPRRREGHSDPKKEAVGGPDYILRAEDHDEDISSSLEKWNEPKANRLRYLATLAGLVLMGLHDAAIGALIPYVRHSPSR